MTRVVQVSSFCAEVVVVVVVIVVVGIGCIVVVGGGDGDITVTNAPVLADASRHGVPCSQLASFNITAVVAAAAAAAAAITCFRGAGPQRCLEH